MGGLLAACGEEETTTTTAAASITTQATTASTAPASTTTVSVAEEVGREIKIGVVMPKTGALAAFGPADEWAAGLTAEVVGDGMTLGDGKKHSINFLLRDCQSDSNRAAQIAGDLIQNDNVDILLGSVTPDVTNPAAEQAEALGTPFLTSYAPWQAFVFGRGADLNTAFKWTFAHSMGTEQMGYSIIGAVDEIPNNKIGRAHHHEQPRRQCMAGRAIWHTGRPAEVRLRAGRVGPVQFGLLKTSPRRSPASRKRVPTC